MGKRIRLGLIFSVNEGWIGGTYYILNLLSALRQLPRDKQPLITILSQNKSDHTTAKKTGYPGLRYHNPFNYKRNIAEAGLNKILKFFVRRDVIDKRISAKNIDVIFPATNDPAFEKVSNKIYWIPDFQHVFYPEFFDKKEIDNRDFIIEHIAAGTQKLVLSSQAAKSDLKSLKLELKCPVLVIPFAVSHSPANEISFEQLQDEFKIQERYFMVANQFWKHKNHMVILQAAKLLITGGTEVQFVLTGKEDDYRNPGYFASLLEYIDKYSLQDTIKIVGFISRDKQLALMKHSVAVIQPSLFEGWSTVIEDAKSLGKSVIASDIPVHREQLGVEGLFFDPHSEVHLAEKIQAFVPGVNPPAAPDYKNAVRVFGESFFRVISDLN